jgi:hypothetical protein
MKFINHAKTSNKSKQREVLVALLLVLAMIIAYAGFRGWSYYKTWSKERDEIASYINSNVSIYNTTSSSSRDLISDLNELVEFDPQNKQDTNERIEKINKKVIEIQTINKTIEENVKELDKSNPKSTSTETLKNGFSATLSTKRFTLVSLVDFLQYQICLIENSSKQSNNLDDFTTQITKFADAQDISFEEKNKFIQAANTKIKQNLQLLSEVEGCFGSDEYVVYYSSGIESELEKDRTLYKNFSMSLDELEKGLASNNSQLVISATTKLVSLAEQDISLFSSKAMKDAIAQPTISIQEQAKALDKQESELQNTLNGLKGEYFLETPNQ